mmetsp:Transcript_19072/g.52967  ORF Transcript_19072/g.52967 Transcript_19072/m.52967 type:complete len:128 (-) Transcript_19072:745-1128(-)|eukprot:CAMPEP_0198134110 /NCGR_PEP_ID=MMETSP1442-20131203/59911_1 /TAXON_ID= /ORGANISM="Craspedostauros australis, Strain CCMP3328" /LENGTH=127 /DNA_ID=CAMNT_0043795249 /DNA_START=139 /DNA_END=522 /DNA_ORIENTATION=-
MSSLLARYRGRRRSSTRDHGNHDEDEEDMAAAFQVSSLLPRFHNDHREAPHDNHIHHDTDADAMIVRGNDNSDGELSRQLLTMAENHLLAFIVIMAVILCLCRILFHWKIGQPFPPTYTVHIRGITD